MIDINTLTKNDIGREVVWIHDESKWTGEIISWNEKFIYVRWCFSFIDSRNIVDMQEKNKRRGLTTLSADVAFYVPPKPIEIITRAELMDFD